MQRNITRCADLALPLLLGMLAISVPCSTAVAGAQSRTEAMAYSRRWFTIDGGGLIAGNQQPTGYRLGGTVGQPDAYVATGGGYRLIGGFWAGVVPNGNVDVPDETPLLPSAFRTLPPSPNPAAGHVAIGFELPQSRDVAVRILDLQGRQVRELDRSRRDPGRHCLMWDGRDDSGRRAPRGLYFVHVDAGMDHGVAKLVLLSNGDSR